jgi:hypothetical protein
MIISILYHLLPFQAQPLPARTKDKIFNILLSPSLYLSSQHRIILSHSPNFFHRGVPTLALATFDKLRSGCSGSFWKTGEFSPKPSPPSHPCTSPEVLEGFPWRLKTFPLTNQPNHHYLRITEQPKRHSGTAHSSGSIYVSIFRELI